MPGARERDTIGPLIENEVGHADKHVLLDIRVKLPVYFLQDVRRGRIPYRLTTQNAAANRHDERRGNAFAGNIGDGNSKPFVIDMDVIEIIAAHLAGWHIDAANLKSVDGWRFGRKQNTLNITRDLKIVVQPLLFVRHRIDDGVIERKGRLLGDRFKNHKVALRKRRAHRAIREGEDTQVLFSVGERCGHDRRSAKSTLAQIRQLRRLGEFAQTNWLP